MTSWSTSGRPNGSYGYRAQACNVGGCGPWSAVSGITVLLPPAPPASIGAPATSSGAIAVSWATSATATTYRLEQSANGGAWTQVYANGGTSTTVTVGASGSYTYRVQACNASGCSGYVASGAVVVTRPPASAPSPSVPSSSSTGSYTISWTSVPGATSYPLLEQVNGGGWVSVQNQGATSWSTSSKGNGSYGYTVQACNAGGCGPWSGTVTITVALVPAAPTGVQTVNYTVNSKREGYRAEWNAVSGATSYEARRTDTGANVYGGAVTSFIIVEGPTPVDPDAVYGFQVRACNAVGCSGWSS